MILEKSTYLPMGRRRIWIIGAQTAIVAVLLVAAFLSPGPSDIWLLSILGFLAIGGVAFQDVATDGLAVDVLPENEREKATGFMFGGQVLGISITTFIGGQLIALYGTGMGYLVAAAIVAAVLIFGIAIREREGEGRMPWSGGKADPRNAAMQVEAWKPLLIESLKAMFAPLSIVFVMMALVFSMPAGVAEAFHPVLATGTGGWTQWATLI